MNTKWRGYYETPLMTVMLVRRIPNPKLKCANKQNITNPLGFVLPSQPSTWLSNGAQDHYL